MHKLLAALVGLLFTISGVLADDIVVLRGSVRLTLDAQTAATFPPLVKAYFVLNYTDGSLAQILYFNKLGKKKLVTASPIRITQVTLPTSKTATVAATAFATDTSSTDFTFSAVQFRGTDVSLLIENSPAKRAIARPRSFIGTSLYIRANPDDPSTLQNGNLTLSVDTAKTIKANNEDQTVEQTRDAIVGVLTAQGYEDVLF